MQKSSNEFANRWANMGKDAREKVIKELEKSGNGVADSIRKILSWQGRTKKFGVSVSPKIDVDYTEFIENKRKLIKETEDKLKANAKRIKFVLGVDVLPNFNFKNTKDVQAFLKLINSQATRLQEQTNAYIRSHRDNKGKVHGEDWNKVQDMRGQMDSLKEYKEFGETILRNGSFLDNEHQSWENNKKNKGKGDGKNKKDIYAESLRREIRALSDAYNVYRQWEKKIGSGGALKKVKEQFFGKDSLLKKQGYSFEDIPNYLETLDKLNEKVIKHYGTKKANKEVVAALQEEIKGWTSGKIRQF